MYVIRDFHDRQLSVWWEGDHSQWMLEAEGVLGTIFFSVDLSRLALLLLNGGSWEVHEQLAIHCLPERGIVGVGTMTLNTQLGVRVYEFGQLALQRFAPSFW